jgi:hypothetical protein
MSEEPLTLKSVKLFLKGFLSSYGLKASINLIFQLMSKKPLNLKQILLDEESLRIGFSIGSFSSIYTFLKTILKNKTKWNEIISGFISGLSILFIQSENRRILTLYMMTRTIHSYIQRYEFFENYGNSALFILSSAQVLYSWAIWPSTLPKSYLSFITKMSPIDQSVLDNVVNYHHSLPMNKKPVEKFCSKYHHNMNHESFPWGCLYLHPHTDSCSLNVLHVFMSSFKKILPLYSFLSLAPVIFHKNLSAGLINTARSGNLMKF